ncbi:MAG: hypothetical protein OEX22_10075 [Cyclobacteriaceae bacterium]|nr:hypothetical protein [Cyclobacteriaceae bacterium]
MQIKYSNHFLSKLEDVLAESEYVLRYEKGSFKSGYCILKETQIVIVNKYFTVEGKINCLIDIISHLDIDINSISEKNKKLVSELSQTTLNL